MSKKLPVGWEILLASHMLGGVVRGKVRLHKVISEMQREGFPVKYHFEILPMGPSSATINVHSRILAHHGFLKIHEIPIGPGYSDRVDYVLTEKGKKKVEEEVLPILKEEYSHLTEKLKEISEKYDNNIMPSEFVRKVHDELFIDDEAEFKERLNKIFKKYRNLLENFKKEDFGFCRVWLAFAGLSDLAVEILENLSEMQELDYDLKDAGKYFILNKAIEGLELISDRYPLSECRENFECASEAWDDCKELEKKVYTVFSALESNAAIYGYLETEEGDTARENLSVMETGL